MNSLMKKSCIPPRPAAWVVPLMVLLAASGCSTYFAVDDQQELARANCVISGTVSSMEAYEAPIIVGLLDVSGEEMDLVDYFVLSGPGRFAFAAEPGTYRLAAFVDLDADGVYGGEPALPPDVTRTLAIAPGEHRENMELVIPDTGRFAINQFSMREIMARGPEEQQRKSLYSLCVVGEVTSLDHERFDREKAEAGMWKFYDFLLARQCGVFFLQPYDPEKIPVLFIHGINGTPRDFASMIAQLDTNRFQPWVYYYPSGATLENASALLLQLLSRLKLEYAFEDLHVVAHSMGGLVAREFVLQADEARFNKVIRTFTTISSPLGGMASAGQGVEHSPLVVSSWRGLDPKGVFQKALFYTKQNGQEVRRTVPENIRYHLLFGYGGESGDGVVKLTSQLRHEAQEEAHSIRGFEEDHASILSSPEAIAYLQAILSGSSDKLH